MKFCIHCKTDLPLEKFGKDCSTPDGMRRWCRNCTNEGSRSKYTPHESFESHLKKRYGLTLGQYNVIKKSQGGKCPICGAMPERLVVDHDHETEEVRGPPCRHCNFMIGNSKESPEVLRTAANYLEHRRKYPLIIPWREAVKIIREQNGAS